MLQSPNANLYQALIEKLKAGVPELRYIEQDLGQLENYEMRPAVAWPCCLIDIEETKYSEAAGKNVQLAVGMISLRLGMVKYTDSNNLVPANIRENALAYYELEHKAYKVLHGWAAAGFGKLLRRASGTEKRDDDIRVRICKFSYGYTVASASPTKIMVPRPGATIGVNE